MPGSRLSSFRMSCTESTWRMALQSVVPPIRPGSTLCASVLPVCGSTTKPYVEVGSSGTVFMRAMAASLPWLSYSSMFVYVMPCTWESSR